MILRLLINSIKSEEIEETCNIGIENILDGFTITRYILIAQIRVI